MKRKYYSRTEEVEGDYDILKTQFKALKHILKAIGFFIDVMSNTIGFDPNDQAYSSWQSETKYYYHLPDLKSIAFIYTKTSKPYPSTFKECKITVSGVEKEKIDNFLDEIVAKLSLSTKQVS